MVRFLAILATTFSLATVALPARAQDADEGGCVHERDVYPDGATRCQDGTRKRCENGAWSDVGDCGDEPGQEPRSGGGDESVPDAD